MSTISLQQNLYQGRHEGTAVAWPAGKVTASATGLVSNQDGLDDTKEANFAIDVSFDNQKTWQQATSYGWMGGTDPKSGGPQIPFLSIGYGSQFPTHARVTIDCPNVVSIGAQLDFS